MKVKIFDSQISTDDLENKIADWTKDLNPKIVSVNVSVMPMRDWYTNRETPTICNQWVEYLASIVYEAK